MLRLLLGEDWIRNRDRTLDVVTERVKERKAGTVLLVPEQISHETERRLCDRAGDTASRYAEVLSFTRLCSRVFAQTGGGARQVLDKGGRIIAMAGAAEQVRSRLKTFGALAARPEFLSRMVSMVDEFKSCGVGPEELRYAGAKTQGVLAQKLEELGYLLESYNAVCAVCGQDPRDRMTQLLEELEASDFGREHSFYIDGFSDFTAQEQAVLAHLIENAPEVTVSLVCREPRDKAPEFSTAGETAFALLRLAERAGVPAKLETVPGRQDGDLETVRGAALSGSLGGKCVGTEGVRALAFSDPWTECTYAAQRIGTLVRAGKARYRDINVVCGEFGGYKPLLLSVFRQYGIPVYVSGTEDILCKSVIATTLTAAEAAAEGLEQEAVLRYCKSLLSPIGQEDCDDLENYVLMWGVTGKDWTREWKFHPDGPEGIWNPAAEERLARLNELRCQAAEPLAELRRAFARAENTGDQILALTEFLRRIRLAEEMETLAQALDAQGDRRGAQEMEQLWEILCGALEQMYGVLGKSVRDTDGFLRLLRLLLSQYDVGTIPAALDRVTLGAVTDLRRRQAKFVFLLGAEEGKLPAYPTAGSLLTEQDREALLTLGVRLSGSLPQQMDQELAGLHAVISAATEGLTVTTGGGQEAFLWKRIRALTGDPGEPELSPYGEAWTAASRLAARGQAEQAETLGISDEYRSVSDRAGYAFGRIRPETVRELYGARLRLSASQIDKAAECRFAYFLRYGIRAKDRKKAQVDAARFGTFVHYVLEHTARDVEEQGGFAQMTGDQVQAIAGKYMEEYTAAYLAELQSRSQREDYLYKRNLEEVRSVVEELRRELSQAQFRPRGFELQFGPEGAMPSIQVRGREMEAEIRGFVDRVDLASVAGRDYVRVVDYKTGKKDFDYCDILSGIGLQMLLYLFALEQGGQTALGTRTEIAGVEYFPARMPIVRTEGRGDGRGEQSGRAKALQRQGLILKDSDVARAMDATEAGDYLPGKRDKAGELRSGAATPGQWRALRDHVFGQVARLIDEISGGTVDPNPYYRGPDHNACRYCEYYDACHLDACGKTRPFRAVGETEFWKTIGGDDNG